VSGSGFDDLGINFDWLQGLQSQDELAGSQLGTHVHSGGSGDAARRLPTAKSDRWGAARSLVAARCERWATVISRRLAAAWHEWWCTTVSRRLATGRHERRAARVVPRGCRVDGGGGDTAADR
jgi:hypothetical protein